MSYAFKLLYISAFIIIYIRITPQALFIPQEKAYYSEIAYMSGGIILCHSLCPLNYKIVCREI